MFNAGQVKPFMLRCEYCVSSLYRLAQSLVLEKAVYNCFFPVDFCKKIIIRQHKIKLFNMQKAYKTLEIFTSIRMADASSSGAMRTAL